MLGRKRTKKMVDLYTEGSLRDRRRADRVRRLGSLVAFVMVIGAVIAVLFLLFLFSEKLLFTGNPFFTVRSIEVTTDGVLDKAVILSLLDDQGIIEGETNLFAIDLPSMRQVMQSRNILVRDVHFSRHVPGTLQVKVFEPHPVAQLGRTFLVDREGRILPGRTDSFARSLPMMTGFECLRDAKEGDRPNDLMLRTSLHLIEVLRTGELNEWIRPTLVCPDYARGALRLLLSGGGPFRTGAELVLPAEREALARALQKVELIARERHRAQQSIGFIDASYEKNIPVRP